MPESRTLVGRGGHVSLGWGDPVAVTAVHIECDQPAYRPFSLADAWPVWQDLALSAEISRREFVRLRERLLATHRQGSALLARHRLRRHR